MLTNTEITEKGLIRLKECLSIIPSIRISILKEPSGTRSRSDYRVFITGESFDQIINLEFKTLGTPKSVRESVNQLLIFSQNEPVYGVVVAPYISPVAASICKESGIGYIDLSGNCHIAFKQIFISRENYENKYPFKTGLSSIYSPKSERILRVLLTYPYSIWKVKELAEAALVSPGMITQVSKKLVEDEWLEKTPQGIRLTQPEKLLEDWVGHYSLNQNALFNFYSLKSLSDVEKNIAENCRTLGISYALTGFSACNRLAPMVKGQRVMIYIEKDIALIADRAGFKPVESGANVVLICPYDQGVFFNNRSMDGMQICNPIQVYLDLKRYPGRGEEAAEFLYTEVIKVLWQQQKLNITALL